LRARRRRPAAAALPPLVLITDRGRLGDPLAAAARLPRGAAVLLRDYDHPARGALARLLARLCRGRGLALLVAGDARLAAAARADGLHLSEAALRRHGQRGRRFRLVTASAHGRTGLVRAGRAGCDAALLSPAFATASHPQARPLGAWRFAALARSAPLPVLALGGIDARSARRLAGTGAAGLAAIGAFGAASRLPAALL